LNRLPGRILRVETSGDLSLVETDVGGDVVASVVLETPESAPHLVPGRAVAVLFKETEVILAPPGIGPVSLRNRLPCRVLGREAGRLLTHFRLEFRGRVIHALITTRSAGDLGLADGDPVLALVKSTEVALEREDA
jgi:molybdate transport system regulatory protein